MNPSNLIYLWKPVLEILVLWFVIYHILLFFKGKRAFQVLVGIFVLAGVFFLVQKLNLLILDWLFNKLFGVSILAILVIFHPEIRQGLAQLGQRHLFGGDSLEESFENVIQQVIKSADYLAKNKIGALIVMAKKDSLNEHIATGVRLDAIVSSELIQTIFTPNSLLHDGGLVIQGGRIVAAGCVFPRSQKQDLSRVFGTRHRAALGLSEETDALVVVVSEERQDMSLIFRGRLHRDLGRDELFTKIKEIIEAKKEND